jgi:5-methylthioribose kinase
MTWSADDAAAYLVDRDVVPSEADPSARSLGGGVSNSVVQVTWDEGCVVLKRPLANLDVAADWPADVARVHNEAAAARAYDEILADELDDRVTAPAVRFEDRETHTVGFECAPADATMWKRDLLEGRVGPSVAEVVGEALGTVIAHTVARPDIEATFESDRPFEQLRLDPYHRTVADRHPSVADAIEAELDRITGVRRALVHGDYSPKNVLVGEQVWLLDFEVAHWGDPTFDVAFMTNHLLIKAVHCQATGVGRFETYVDAAERFRTAVERAASAVDPSTAVVTDEASLATELAILMIARVDGKSPVEYVDEATASTLRRVSKGALEAGIGSVDALVDRLREAVR